MLSADRCQARAKCHCDEAEPVDCKSLRQTEACRAGPVCPSTKQGIAPGRTSRRSPRATRWRR